MSKFLIISCFDEGENTGFSYKELSDITSKSVIEYCDLHGYSYLIENKDLDPARHSSWSKVSLSRKYLANYDWVWCTDIDIMIMNQTIRLENIVDDNYDVLITCYDNNIDLLNTGSIIYKNTPWTHEFLKEIYDDTKYPIGGPYVFFEQSAIINFYKNNPSEQKHFKMIHPRVINSHYHAGFINRGFNYSHGDFVVHTAGTDNSYRIEAFKSFEKYIIRPDPTFNVEIWNR